MLNTYCHLIRLLGTGSQLAALAENVGYNGNGYDQRSIMTSSSGVTPATVQTLNFVMEDSTAQIPAGSKIIMLQRYYGIPGNAGCLLCPAGTGFYSTPPV